MKNIHKSASEINKLLENSVGILVEKDLAVIIINHIHTYKVHYASGENYIRTFYMNGDNLYVAVSEKDLSKYDFYRIDKKLDI